METGYFCNKCKCVPLIQIVPKEKDIKFFCCCKCKKQLLNYDFFMKQYYKTNLNYSEISNEPIYKEYIDPNPIYKDNKNDINLENINNDFNYIVEKINEYNLEIKTKIIEILNNKIKEIENAYEINRLNNIKLQNIIKRLINNYQSNINNVSNIKNLLYNTSFNKGYKNETYSKLNFNDKNMSLDTLIKNVLNYLKTNYILSSYNEQLYQIKKFFNHSKEVTCVIEVANEIIASSSKDSYIILYNLEKKKCIYKYKAHENGVNWLLNINNNNNILSCGGDNKIKIWPKINKANLELVNSEFNGTTNTEEIVINPIAQFSFEEPILKTILIDNIHLCACDSENIYLIKYEIVNENTEKDNKIENSNEIIDIKFDVLESINIDNILDIFKAKDKYNDNLIVVYCSSKICFLSLSKLDLKKEIKNVSIDKQTNCITQINKEDILVANNNCLRLININNYQIKLKRLNFTQTTFISKLKDNTILLGTKEGIKRINNYNLEEISLINKIYSFPNYSLYGNVVNQPPAPEKFNYVYEFADGRLAICSSYGNIKICKFKIS